MDRVWKTAMVAAMVCACMLAMTSGAFAKLDKSFGKGGKVTMAFPVENAGSSAPKYTLPFEFTQGHLEMAKAPSGKVVVAGATKIVRYLANGKLDKSFGSGGSVSVPRPPGAVFVLAGVAVDSQGRIVLAGLARPLPSNSAPDPLLSMAAVMRFNADGTPDPTFGNGGMVVSDFGLGAPKAQGGPYLGASVGLRDVVVDSLNRPVVTGAYVTEIGSGRESAESSGFVARLTETGALDPSFGDKGMRTVSGLLSLGQLAPHSAEYLTLAERSERPRNLLTSIDEDGNLDTSFASFGFRSLRFPAAPTMAISPAGRILLLGRPETHRSYRNKKVKDEETGKIVTEKVRIYIKQQTIQRLLPSGAGDPSFGHSGTVAFTDPKQGSYGALATDTKERVYLAGRIAKGNSKKAKKGPHRTEFLLGRLKSNGKNDKSFGRRGIATTDFGHSADSFATQVMLDPKGGILVGGGLESPQLESGGGFALVRYLP
jgi:uncharacterized delta-60 repeat protein